MATISSQSGTRARTVLRLQVKFVSLRHGNDMRRIGAWLWQRRIGLAGWLAVAVFATLVGRFWHPCYGFTKFLMLDERAARAGVHELRDNPVYVYGEDGGYDGRYYVQIAFHPGLDAPDLAGGMDNFSYRARRILGSALAWVLAGGAPCRIAGTYAALNLGVWFVLAGLLWRLLAVTGWRSWLAWAGLLFSAGALHSVRLALPDLLGATLLAAMMLLAERQRRSAAFGALALAGLARETTLAAVVALWAGPWRAPHAWLRNLGRVALVALPLVLWLVYVHLKAGPLDSGVSNFSWPFVGWVEKGVAAVYDLACLPDYFRWLGITTFLAFAGLTVQAIYLLRRPDVNDAWWRLGAVYVAMMLGLGTSVWEGQPGAAVRVLLPLSLAFAVRAVRLRAGLVWLLAGNLTVFSGVLALWHVPTAPRELAAGRAGGDAYLVQLGDGWFGTERQRSHVWAWSAGRAGLELKLWAPGRAAMRVSLGLRSLARRPLEIRQEGRVIWRGEVGPKLQQIHFSMKRSATDTTQLEFVASGEPVRESAGAGARPLSFAVYDVRID